MSAPAEKPLSELLATKCPDAAIATALQGCLSATTTSRGGVVEPDNRIRLEAARLILAYRHGTPVQRNETISVNLDADSALGMEERLRNSPALRETLGKLLARASEGDVPLLDA